MNATDGPNGRDAPKPADTSRENGRRQANERGVPREDLPAPTSDDGLLSERPGEQAADPDVVWVDDEERVYMDAVLIADTRCGEVQLGFRNLCLNERRMLFQANDAYVELLVPSEAHESLEGGWLYGQFITPTEEARAGHAAPVYAVLAGEEGMTGAARATPLGDFTLPCQHPGSFELLLEPRTGPTIRVRFDH